jgi:hypothetical protein
MKLPVLLATLATVAAFTNVSANAATLSYSLSGGGFTGTFNGAAFTATGFNITATGDTSTIVSGDLVGNGPAFLIPVSPAIEIFTLGGGSLTATLQPTAGKTLMAASVDFTGSVAHGFIIFDSFASPIIGGLGSFAPGTIFSNLATPGTFNGQLSSDTTTFPSSSGPIVFNFPAETDSTFTVSSVPEPATAAATLLSTFAGMLLVSRRRRSS